MERAPLKPPAGSTASTANESTLQKIRIDLFGDSITEKDYKKGMEQQQAGNDPGDYEYIDRLQKWPDGTPVHLGIQVAIPGIYDSSGYPDEKIWIPGLKDPGQFLRQFGRVGLKRGQIYPEHPPDLPIPKPAQRFLFRNQHVHRFLVIIKAKLRRFPVSVPDAGRSKPGQLPGKQVQVHCPVRQMFFQLLFPIFLHPPISSKSRRSIQDWRICCPSSSDWAIRNRWGLR